METTEEQAWDRACPHCGAKMHRRAEECWLCSRSENDAPPGRVFRPKVRHSREEILTGVGLAAVAFAVMCATVVAAFGAFVALCSKLVNIGPG